LPGFSFVVVTTRRHQEEVMMRYMLLMCGEVEPAGADATQAPTSAPTVAGGEAAAPTVVTSEADEPCWMPWAREMAARGVILHDGAQLQHVSTATTVRTNGDEVLVADGPFAETKEVILGYDVIECADLDEAIFAASRHPVARNGGVVEVRPVLAY
jgi:hypothetical protein